MKIGNWVSKLGKTTFISWLIVPANTVTRAEDRHRAQLLATILVFVISLAALTGIIRQVFFAAFDNNFPFVIITLIFLALAYGLARTRYYRLGVYCVVIGLWISIFVAVIDRPNELMELLSFLALSIIIADIFLSTTATGLVTLLTLFGITFLPLANPQISFDEDLIHYQVFIGSIAAAVLISGRHRRKLEIEHQAKLQQQVNERTEQLATINQLLEKHISQREVIEKALRESEKHYRLIAEHSTDMISTHNTDGIYLYASPACQTLLGYEAGELVGRSAYEFFHPEDLEAIRTSHTGVVEQPVVNTVTYRIRRRDGNYTWFETTSKTVRDPATDEVQEIIAVSRDISQRMAAENARRRSEQLHRTIVKQFPGGAIALFDRALRYLAAGGEAFQTINADSEVLVGRTVWEVYAEEPATLIEEHYRRALAGQASEFEMEYASRVFEVHVHPVRNETGEIYAGIVMTQDITQRKEYEENTRQLNRDLEQRAFELKAANEELEAFSYSVSHDLRAPLRSINGFSYILAQEFADELPEDAQHYLKRIQDGAQQMNTLIEDLLQFSRTTRRELTKRQLDQQQLVQEVIHELHPETDVSDVLFSIGELPTAYADRALLKQVYMNLIGNALKFARHREPAHITIGSQNNGEEHIYFVKDNGVGFDMRYAYKLFGVFQRLHRPNDYEGTGVGLATVQRIIHRHGGRIWAEAEVDVGATFFFTLGDEDYHHE